MSVTEQIADDGFEPDLRAPRWHNGAESWYMCHAKNWVMVGRPGCVPYTIHMQDWLLLPTALLGRKASEQYRSALHPSKDNGHG